MYNAIADQISLSDKIPKDYFRTLRRMTADYMLAHADEFLPFVEIDGVEMIDEIQFKEYCEKVASTNAWGGQLELKALAGCLKAQINVFTAVPNAPEIKMGEGHTTKPLLLS
jgi:OTU domain-containing protein 6